MSLNFTKKIACLVISMIASLFSYATLVSNPDQTNPIVVTKGFAPATLRVRLTFTTSGNGTTTFTLPAGMRYVPGSVTDDNATVVIAESNITNPGAPVFSITGAATGQAVIISVNIEAGCAAGNGSATVAVAGTILPADNFSGNIAILLNQPFLTLSGHPPTTAAQSQSLSVNIVISSTAAAPVDDILFYIRENSAGNSLNSTTDSVKVGSILIPLLRRTGDTSFYLIPSSALPGGSLENGESITVTRFVSFGACSTSGGDTFSPGIDEDYFINYESSGVRCLSPATTVAARFNYSASGNGTPSFTDVLTTLNSPLSICSPLLQRLTITNNGSGNLANAGALNVYFEARQNDGGAWPTGAYGYDSVTFESSIPAFNGVRLTATGAGIGGSTAALFGSFANVFNSDPDGPGVGLADLDNDGFFDDLPAGASYSIILHGRDLGLPNNTCTFARSDGRMLYGGVGASICGRLISSIGFGFFDVNGGTGTAVLLSSSPSVGAGQTGILQEQVTLLRPSGLFTCTVNEYVLAIPLPAGVAITGVRLNGSPRTVVLNGTGDTATASLGAVPGIQITGTLEISFTTTPGVTPASFVLDHRYLYKCDNTCPLKLTGCATSNPISVPGAITCPNGGAGITTALVERTTAGFTNNTGTTKVDLSTVSAVNRRRALPCDSVRITASAVLQSGVEIVGGENMYYRIEYDTLGTENLFTWLSGTYTINGNTLPLGAPAFEGTVGEKHVAIYAVGSGFPIGTVVNIALSGRVLNANGLPNDGLYAVRGFENLFFNLKAGVTDPSPITGNPTYSCGSNNQLEMYLRRGKWSVQTGTSAYVLAACNPFLLNTQRNVFVRGQGTSNVDYFPGEVRPLITLDSIVLTLQSGITYVPGSLAAGTEFLIVRGTASEGGFPVGGATNINLGTPIVSGNTVKWINNGSWLIPDDASTGGYLLYAQLRGDCLNSPTTYELRYYGKENGGGDPSCATPVNIPVVQFAQVNKPRMNFSNLSGPQVGDEAIECFDFSILINNNGGNATNSYIAFPGGGTGGIYTVTSLTNTSTGVSLPILNYAGGQYFSLGTLLQNATTAYRLCVSYSSCNQITINSIMNWDCSVLNPNPGAPACANGATGTFVINPVPSALQSQITTQPVGNITLCDTAKYVFKYTSLAAADVVNGAYTVTVPAGMNISKARIRYPGNSTTPQTITPSAVTGTVNIPLALHDSLTNGLKGVSRAASVAEREALLELDFVTDCNFISGQNLSVTATGSQPCGSTAQGNGFLLSTNAINVSGAAQNYFSIFSTLNVGADSIITCEPQTVSTSVTLFDEPGIPGGSSLSPATDSLKITLPNGIAYLPGSYNCTGANCFEAPVLSGNTLTFPVPAGGISIPDGGNVVINFSFDINALGQEACGLPGLITLRTVRTLSGIACASAPGGTCPGVGFVTGGTSRTIVARKATITGLTTNNIYSYNNDTYRYFNGSFTITNEPLPAGQNLQLEVFCRSGGVTGTTPVHTQSFAGPIAVNAVTNFNGNFAGVCSTDSLVFRLAPTTAANVNQCVCGAQEIIKYAPFAIQSRDTVICEGNTVNLSTLTTNVSGDVITYHSTNADAVSGTSAIAASVNPTVTTKYYIRNAFLPTVFATDSITVTVNPSPNLTARDTAVCLNAPVNLTTMFTANAVTGTITYYDNYVNAIAQAAPILSATVTPAATTRYFIRKQSALGCFDIDSVLVTVNPLPLADTRDSAICIGSPVNLNLLIVPNGVTAALTFHNTIGDANTGAAPISATVNPAVPTTYFTRRVSTPQGCVAVDSIRIVVNPVPDLIARDTAVCLGAGGSAAVNLSQSFTSDPIPGFINYFTTFAAAQANTGGFISPNVTVTAPIKYYVRKTSPLGCFDIDSIDIATTAAPLIDARDTTICSGNNTSLPTLVALVNAVPGTLSFYTTLGNALSQTGAIPASTVAPAGTTKYYVRKQSPAVCFAIDSITVNVTPKPSGGADQLNVCILNVATLTAITPTTGLWTAIAGNPGGATLGGTTAGVATVNFTTAATGNYDFIYTADGCTDTTRLVVRGGFDNGDLPAPWPAVQTGVLSCINGSGVPNGATGAVWAGNGVNPDTGNPGGVGSDPFDDGLIRPSNISVGVPFNVGVILNSNISGKTVYYGLWFDWNDNGNFADDVDFSGNPAFYSGSGVTASPVTVTNTVVPPLSALATYKVRLIVADAPILSTGFAGTYVNGEAEDYITISTLPVKLTAFTSTVTNCKATLSWASATEDNLKHYELQQSTNGVNYVTVATVAGTGNDSRYTQNNISVSFGNNYYRLKMVDNDGSISYSNTLSVNGDCSDRSITVYPNPAVDMVNINIEGYSGAIIARLFNSNGSMVKTSQMRNGKNVIDVTSLPSGLYSISFTDQKGNVQNRKIDIVR